jgi:hypothetical protein
MDVHDRKAQRYRCVMSPLECNQFNYIWTLKFKNIGINLEIFARLAYLSSVLGKFGYRVVTEVTGQ